jgi:hypothetical protein
MNSDSKIFDFIEPKLKFIPIFVFSLYFFGFIITNSWFSVLGIYNLEILKVRYISAGLTFLIFVTAVIYLIHSSTYVWVKNIKKPMTDLSYQLMSSIMPKIFFVMILTGLISEFTRGRTSFPNTGSPNGAFEKYVQEFTWNKLLYPAIAGLVSALYQFLVWCFAKNRFPFEQMGKNILRSFPIVFIFAVIWFEYFNIAKLIFGADANKLRAIFILIPTDGWLRYFIGIIATYVALFVSLMSQMSFRDNPPKDAPTLVDIIDSSNYRIVIYSIILFLILPIYAFNIYPFLPQQLGGGKFIDVSEVAFISEVSKQIGEEEKSIKIIDKSQESIIFYIEKLKEGYVIEIPKSKINLIKYTSY